MTAHPLCQRIAGCLGQVWFYLALAGFSVFGWLRPEAGVWLKSIHATDYLVALVFFLNGFTLSTTDLLGNLRQWRFLVAAMLLVFGCAPALVFAVRVLLPVSTPLLPLAAGFQLLAVVPPTLVSAIVLTRVAGGNSPIALYITVLANVLAVFLVPLVMRLTLGIAGVQLDAPAMSIQLGLLVLLPTLAGQLARRRWRAWAVTHARTLGIISQFTILLFILTGFAALRRQEITPHIWLVVLVGGIALHLILLGVAQVTGRVIGADQGTRRALVLTTAQKSLVLSVFLWERLLAPLGPLYALAILPAIVFYLFELLFDSVLAQWWGRGAHATHPLPVPLQD